ncbi:unnamed protein product [Sphagnum balticum]
MGRNQTQGANKIALERCKFRSPMNISVAHTTASSATQKGKKRSMVSSIFKGLNVGLKVINVATGNGGNGNDSGGGGGGGDHSGGGGSGGDFSGGGGTADTSYWTPINSAASDPIQ